MVLLSQELINARIRENELLESIDVDNRVAAGEESKKAFQAQFKNKAWWPLSEEWDADARSNVQRSKLERLHLAFSEPSSCKFAYWFTTFVLTLIVVSCISFVLETMPNLQVFPSQWCTDHCKPVSGLDRNNQTLLDEREAFKDQCTNCEPRAAPVFFTIECICMAVFITEYAIRLATAHSLVPPNQRGPSLHHAEQPDVNDSDAPTSDTTLKGQRRGSRPHEGLRRTVDFVIKPLNVVDVVSILPFIVNLLLQSDGAKLAIVRILRLMRVLKLFREGGLSAGLALFYDVFKASTLVFLITGVLVLFSTIVLGTLVYDAERGDWDSADGLYKRPALHHEMPDEVSPYTSIPITFWWVIVTFCTVGYGDMSPTTPMGLSIGVLSMYFGILFLAMPITVIGANFADVFSRRERAKALIRSETRRQQKLLKRMVFYAGWSDESDEHELRDSFKRCWDRWRMLVWVPSSPPRSARESARDVINTDSTNADMAALLALPLNGGASHMSAQLTTNANQLSLHDTQVMASCIRRLQTLTRVLLESPQHAAVVTSGATAVDLDGEGGGQELQELGRAPDTVHADDELVAIEIATGLSSLSTDELMAFENGLVGLQSLLLQAARPQPARRNLSTGRSRRTGFDLLAPPTPVPFSRPRPQ